MIVVLKVSWDNLFFLFSFFRDAFVIFSGGLPHDTAGRSPSITVMQGKNITVLEMEHNVVDFVTLCENPWNFGKQFIYLFSLSVKQVM